MRVPRSLLRAVVLVTAIGLAITGYAQSPQDQDEPDSGDFYDDGSKDAGAEVEGDALAYSQSELRQIMKHGWGLALIGGTPWLTAGGFRIKAWDANTLQAYQLAIGNHTFNEKRHGVDYEHEIDSFAGSVKWQYFFSDYVPFYIGLDAGAALWQSSIAAIKIDSANFDAKSHDIGIFTGANAGFLWITQDMMLWGVNLFNAYYNVPLLTTAESGAGDGQGEIRNNLRRGYAWVNFGIQWAYLF